MKDLDKIEEKIDKTLASLEHIERATPRPFFYTRLEAKIQKKHAPIPNIVLRPVFIWSFLALIVFINLSVVINYATKPRSSEEQNANAFAQEYGLSSLDTNL